MIFGDLPVNDPQKTDGNFAKYFHLKAVASHGT